MGNGNRIVSKTGAAREYNTEKNGCLWQLMLSSGRGGCRKLREQRLPAIIWRSGAAVGKLQPWVSVLLSSRQLSMKIASQRSGALVSTGDFEVNGKVYFRKNSRYFSDASFTDHIWLMEETIRGQWNYTPALFMGGVRQVWTTISAK